MAKVRVHELAKELGVDAKTLIGALNEMGDPVKTASARLDRRAAQNLAEHPAVRARRTERSELPSTEDLVGSETRTDTATCTQAPGNSDRVPPPTSQRDPRQEDQTLPQIRQRVSKAVSRVEGAAAQTAELERIAQLDAAAPMSKRDAEVPALRPALARAAHERSRQDIEVVPPPAKTRRRMQPKRPKPEGLTPKNVGSKSRTLRHAPS